LDLIQEVMEEQLTERGQKMDWEMKNPSLMFNRRDLYDLEMEKKADE
jgi:hypothetical protein